MCVCLQLTRISIGTDAAVILQRFQLTSAAVVATRLIAGIGHCNLAQRLLKPKRAQARDAGATVPKGHLTGAAILAASVARQAGIPMFTVVANIACIATANGKERYEVERDM